MSHIQGLQKGDRKTEENKKNRSYRELHIIREDLIIGHVHIQQGESEREVTKVEERTGKTLFHMFGGTRLMRFLYEKIRVLKKYIY